MIIQLNKSWKQTGEKHFKVKLMTALLRKLREIANQEIAEEVNQFAKEVCNIAKVLDEDTDTGNRDTDTNVAMLNYFLEYKHAVVFTLQEIITTRGTISLQTLYAKKKITTQQCRTRQVAVEFQLFYHV